MRKRSEVAVSEVSRPEPPPDESPAANVQDFVAPDAPLEVPLTGDFMRIVESIYIDRPFESYKRLEQALVLGETRGDYGSLVKALDEAETNAREAHRLWMTARLERVRWEKDNEMVRAAMRQEATRHLEQEKEAGARKKQITEADVEGTCNALFPDEWKHQEMKREKVKAMEETTKNLCERWSSRCAGLQTMVKGARR